jgi:HEAT repeat protein
MGAGLRTLGRFWPQWGGLALLALGCAGLLSAGQVQLAIIKGPYLQDAQQNSIVVMWETSLPADSKVLFGETPELGREALSPGRQQLHRVSLAGLPPGRLHYYKVVSGPVASATYTFKTAPPDAGRPITFVVYGDNRGGVQKHRTIAALIGQAQPDFILHTGDMLVDGRIRDEWGTCLFDPLKEVICWAPIYPTMGNHEMLSEYYYAYFSPPPGGGAHNQAYYSFDYGPAHIVSVNVYEDYKPGSPQFKWLRNDLRRAEKAPWRIVFFHFAPFSSGVRRTDLETLETRAYLQGLFDETRVDVVFSAHDHIYERSFPIVDTRRDDANGVTYIIEAGGGATLYDYDIDPQWWSAYVEPRHNFCLVKADGHTLSMEMHDIKGEVFDQFRISKDGKAIEDLMAQLAGANPQQKIEIAGQLGQFANGRIVQPLLGLLDDPNVSVRRAASSALAASAQAGAVPGILQRLDQPGAKVWEAGLANAETLQNLAEALARSREPSAIRGLVKLADSPDELTRLVAMGGIRWIANTAAPGEPLTRPLGQINPTLQRYAIASLRKLVQILERTTDEGALKDSGGQQERLKAIKSFQENPDEAAAGPLLDLLRMEWQDINLKKEIFKALERIDPQKRSKLKAIILAEAMKSPSNSVRCNVAELLDTTDHRKAVPLLIEALGDDRVEVRSSALNTLQRISGRTYGKDTAKWQAWYEKTQKRQ